MGCRLKIFGNAAPAAFVTLASLIAVNSASAATYILTVAGLGGEADYEQRFTLWANDTDKILKAGGTDRVVETLKGADATRAKVEAALSKR